MTGYTTPHSLPYPEKASKIASDSDVAGNLRLDIKALAEAANSSLEAVAAFAAAALGIVQEGVTAQGGILEEQGGRLVTVEEDLKSPRLPIAGEKDYWGIADRLLKIALGVRPDGSVDIGTMNVIPSKDWTIEDINGLVAFGVSRYGKILGPLGDIITISRVVIIACLGQSNAVAYSAPASPEMDSIDPLIWQMPYGGTELIPAKTPLNGIGTTPGLAPGYVLAKEYLKDAPAGTVVVLVPMGVGGTGLAPLTTSTSGVWSVDYTGPYRHLFEMSVETTLDAFDAAEAQWGITPTYLAATWNQGEQDATDQISRATYEAELDKLITTFRTRIGATIPFIIGGMVPEWVEEFGTAPRANIRKAHLDTPRRLERVAYADGIRNTGGSAGVPADLVHYSREGITRLGRAMYRQLPHAQNNTAASKITVPLDLTATVWSGELEATWTPPSCRITGYEIQTSPNGTTWTTLTRTEPMETRHISTITGPVKVRIRALGSAANSAYTTPIKAIGV